MKFVLEFIRNSSKQHETPVVDKQNKLSLFKILIKYVIIIACKIKHVKMFSDFKKRMSAVIQEGRTISENLSNTYIRQQQHSPAHSPSSTLPPKDAGHHVPYLEASTAGCAYLAQQERSWKEIHKGTETNAATAEQIDGQIQTILCNTANCMTQLGDLNSSLGCIPEINRQLVKCTELVQSIGKDCQKVQQSLFELEDLLEVLQLQERQLDRKFGMAMYREKKMGK